MPPGRRSPIRCRAPLRATPPACHIYTHPKDDDYATETKIDFGDDVDLADTLVGLALKTDEFPRD
ncbi:hypothetical protein [Streptomyces sp. NPDC020298]|uniref:hypothetical protein n=1 Tax=unclassified Streptomyces TaxID=2593676 RepID=UPI0033D379E0